MDILRKQHEILIKHISTEYIRDLYGIISWDERLIGIKGPRGVGKTTLILQRIKIEFGNSEKALYVSLDDIWFGNHSLLDLANIALDKGVTHLFIDEIHRLKGWEKQLKNIYDFFPMLHVVFTGSSLLEIDNSIADLSRRCVMYDMPGLSFREYLQLEGYEVPKISLSDILYNHSKISNEIIQRLNIDIVKAFHKYLQIGYYPYYSHHNVAEYYSKVRNTIISVIDLDIPSVSPIEYATQLKLKQLLGIISSQTPSTINIIDTSKLLGISSNLLIKLLSLLERSKILTLIYYKSEHNPRSMAKPNKILFGNSSIQYALGEPNIGKVRESFFASAIKRNHALSYPKLGDFLVDERYLFEIGGASKGFTQIKDIPDSFVAADDISEGFGNKIPLWLFGLL